MRQEIYHSSKEKWFNKNLPIPDQLRLVAGTFDLDIGKEHPMGLVPTI